MLRVCFWGRKDFQIKFGNCILVNKCWYFSQIELKMGFYSGACGLLMLWLFPWHFPKCFWCLVESEKLSSSWPWFLSNSKVNTFASGRMGFMGLWLRRAPMLGWTLCGCHLKTLNFGRFADVFIIWICNLYQCRVPDYLDYPFITRIESDAGWIRNYISRTVQSVFTCITLFNPSGSPVD